MDVLIVGRRLEHHPHVSDAGTVVVHSCGLLFLRRQARCFVVDGVIRLSLTLDDRKLQ